MNLIIEFGPQSIALLLAVFQLNKLSLAYKFIFLQLCLTIVTDALALWSKNHINTNESIYNVYVIIEMVLLSFAIYNSIDNVRFKKLIQYTTGAFVPISIIAMIFNNINELNYPILIFSFLSIAFFNLYFIIHPKTEKSLFRNAMMIIAIGHVIYFLGVTPYFVGRHLLIEAYPQIAHVLFSYINMSLAAIRYLCIAVAFGILLMNNKRSEIA